MRALRGHVAGYMHVLDAGYIAHVQVRLPGNRGSQVVQRTLIDAELRNDRQWQLAQHRGIAILDRIRNLRTEVRRTDHHHSGNVCGGAGQVVRERESRVETTHAVRKNINLLPARYGNDLLGKVCGAIGNVADRIHLGRGNLDAGKTPFETLGDSVEVFERTENTKTKNAVGEKDLHGRCLLTTNRD